MILLCLIISALLRGASAFDLPEDYFGPPASSDDPNLNQPDPEYLEIDEASGCLCRTIPGRLVICFGRSSCVDVPTNVTVAAPALKLTSTHIPALRPGDFDRFVHLEALQVEGNFNLSRVVPGSLDPLTNLRNLSVSFNPNLKSLEPGTFDALVELRTLYLIKNGFQELRAVASTLNRLPKLAKLSLNENNFVRVDEMDFDVLRNSRLEELNLVLCSLEFIHPDAFSPLKHLQALRLGENNFPSGTMTEVIRSIQRAKLPLKLLNLFSAGFRVKLPIDLLKAVSDTNVTFLTLARNQFTIIDKFPYMPNIKTLDLREVLALDIKHDAFAGLPGLTTLLLSGNKLPSIPKGSLLPSLKNLDLQNNAGGNAAPSYFSISNKIFADMGQLLYLNLNFNNIYHLFNESFVGLDNLKVLGLKNSTIYHIENNTFAPLRNLLFLNLENNDFVRHNSPDGIWPDIFAGLGKLQVLLLGGCSISRFNQYGRPFVHLTNLVHLGLQNNQLEKLDANDFSTLTKLKSLDLSYNLLKMWDSTLFTQNTLMSTLILHHNKIPYITTSMFQDFSRLTTLELGFNAITCDCTLYRSWSAAPIDKSKMLALIGATCCIYPISLANCSVADFFENVQNCDTQQGKLIVMLPLMLLVLFFVTLAAFVYYYRWHIKYWVFLTRLYLSRKGKIHRKTTGYYSNFVYDAFISYSNEDRNFVVRLASMLENYEPFLKLCVYERDFEVGSYISESILESVAKSRKTVLIISDSYAKSVWCRWESQLAEHHRLFFENEDGDYVDDSLILVKLGPVSNGNLTPTLRYLLKTRVYLQWEADEAKQRVFWEKLRQTLAPPERKVENTHM